MLNLNKKENRLQSQKVQFDSLINQGYTQEIYKGLNIFVLKGDKIILKVFKNTSSKSLCFYSYRSESSLNASIADYKSNYDRNEVYKKELKDNPKKSSAANCAQAIREELKAIFPDIKFSVKSSNFSMGNSVHISYTDGPTSKQVEEVTDKYQYGHFNGMEDIYENSNSRDDIPQSKYVSVSRQISDQLDSILLPQLTELMGDYTPGDWRNEPKTILRRILRRILNKTSLPTNWKVKGIERTDVMAGQFEDFYKVVFESTEQEEVQKIAPIEVPSGTVQIIEYSEKAIAVIGDTKPIKEKLGKNGLGGKFNMNLSCGPGWIFPKSRLNEIKNSLTA